MTKSIILALVFAATPAGEGGVPRYEFERDTDRLVGIYRGDALLVGRLDANGKFHQLSRHEASELPPGGGPDAVKVITYRGPGFERLNEGSSAPRKVYELRSGMLIPGTIRARSSFVPEAGGTIIRFSDYRYSPFARLIWNLPGRYVPSE